MSRQNLPMTITGCSLAIFQQLTGINAIMFYGRWGRGWGGMQRGGGWVGEWLGSKGGRRPFHALPMLHSAAPQRRAPSWPWPPLSLCLAAPVMFSSLSSTSTALLNAVVIGATNVLSTLFGVLLIDRCGRRLLLLEGGIQMLLAEVRPCVVC